MPGTQMFLNLLQYSHDVPIREHMRTPISPAARWEERSMTLATNQRIVYEEWNEEI
jgi:hypothetical protein